MLGQLSGYLRVDAEKRQAIDDLLNPKTLFYSRKLSSKRYEQIDYCKICEDSYIPSKYCPECGREYAEEENFCPECLVSLKRIDDMVDVRDITFKPEFPCVGYNYFTDFDEIFCDESLEKINDFTFTMGDYKEIVKSIKVTSIKNMEEMIKSNELSLDLLSLEDKVLLFTKSFAEVSYKSYGQELGYFMLDKITVDDRLSSSLLITTLIHELSHYLLGEILTQILCRILDCTRNSFVEAVTVFILSYSPFTRLIDEYCAHTVEGRFTVYGYQDYSSFLEIERSLEGEMTLEEIEITKSIGNTFAVSIKEILETFLDRDLREEIKKQFLRHNFEKPNYEMLRMENCNTLTGVGFKKAIRLILVEGFGEASRNLDALGQYESSLH